MPDHVGPSDHGGRVRPHQLRVVRRGPVHHHQRGWFVVHASHEGDPQSTHQSEHRLPHHLLHHLHPADHVSVREESA